MGLDMTSLALHAIIDLMPNLRRFARSLTGSADAGNELVQVACERILSRPELDFAQIRWGFVSAWECSSGEACRVEQAVGERSGDFYHVPALA